MEVCFENPVERARPARKIREELDAGEMPALQYCAKTAPNFHASMDAPQAPEKLFRKSASPGIQSRARKQTDNALVWAGTVRSLTVAALFVRCGTDIFMQIRNRETASSAPTALTTAFMREPAAEKRIFAEIEYNFP